MSVQGCLGKAEGSGAVVDWGLVGVRGKGGWGLGWGVGQRASPTVGRGCWGRRPAKKGRERGQCDSAGSLWPHLAP